ncbi:dynein axonemal intermediate chain 7 isoform X2 [Sciurus carolinensis]|uniref:dynein axonemal intermediate chain 7 isoform X2 n=1 Tax=Sciurus carolinensis TaxID=30640 RepID=UPI001FB42462|nr:dynein axonemal intermediate chain 7 isoform X2 [Sciurus carolinensis]
MNTFISLWKEETNQTFEEVIEKSKLVLRLIEKLKLILMEMPPFDLEEQSIIQYQGSILQLQELLHLKFNKATEILLRQASTLADLDSGNMEKVIQDENVTLYVWANLKKNPRFKSVKFAGTQIGFEIPRILATSDIAIRLLHTHYDHVTPLHFVRTEQENSILMTEAATDEAKTRESKTRESKTRESKTRESKTIEVKIIEEPVNQEDQEEYKPQASDSNLNYEDETKVEEQGVTEAQRTSEAIKGELEIKLLSESVSAAQLFLIENTTEKPDIYEDNEVDLCQFTTLGGVYHLDILELPPQCKPVKGWMIVQENLCMLASIKLKGKEPISILEGKWMSPISFIIALKEAGLNIFPAGYSHFYVVINNKTTSVEMKAYRQMALLSSAFAFGWSKWNIVCHYTKVIFKVREQPSEELTENPNWVLLMFSGDRAQRLKMNEESESFSEALQEGTEFHSTLYHMMKDIASREAMEKINSSNCQFIDSVCYMLLSTRLLSYS